ncbi:phytoene/squalene synthase family protein [Shimazuella sp. AN120528]|uniref:squalene/phytoene synthase family protein n=1 Tax=Shimazuella soli TaxID=1892854 RepID=UPI001F0D4DB1|nr:phytoene/squalene synthase family protein [Shimazuella soli]MCH5585433.1 phytoene/squalene synthase family protein [Shimazuella soli]
MIKPSASALYKEAFEVLEKTSRTFSIPISYLTDGLKEAVASAYLCMRAIDEIEDHPDLPSATKHDLLVEISKLLNAGDMDEKVLNGLYKPYQSKLPEVTLRLSDWLKICPPALQTRIKEATSIMAQGMAEWVMKDWQIKTEKDLDDYTYYVAGLVGVMLSDIWEWHDETKTDRDLAIAFGRGLQSVNILRNRSEDKDRGVNFFPDGWGEKEMFDYAKRNLELGDTYIESLNPGSILHFCEIPLALAHGTLDGLAQGREKISRTEVKEIVNRVVSE